jgi:HEAT repeat protein
MCFPCKGSPITCRCWRPDVPLIRKDPVPVYTSAVSSDSPVEQLRSDSADARFAAARNLSGQPEAAAALGAALAIEQDPQVREAILTALARVGNGESVEIIAPLIRSDYASVRTGALDALRLIPDAVGAHLTTLLADADPDVRLLACELARQLPELLATRLMSGLLQNEPEPNVCAAALDVLAEVGGSEALPVLAECRARFADVPFLEFAIRVAGDRIRSKPPEARG